MVKKRLKGSIGAAPDMLFINKGRLIVVEMTMKSSFKLNADYSVLLIWQVSNVRQCQITIDVKD